VGMNSSFRVCDQCQQRIPADSVFCPECGVSQRPTRVGRNAGGAPRQGFSALWGLIGAGILLVVVLVVINQHHGPQSVAAGTPTKHSSTPSTSTHHPTPSTGAPSSSVKAHPQSKPKVTPPPVTTKKKAKSSTTPVHPKAKVPSTPPTILAGWNSESLAYQGATISVTLPKSLTESATKLAAGQWLFANSGNSTYNVQVSALPTSYQVPSDATAFGPDAYGTPISHQGKVTSQTLYIDWTGHAWIAVAMAVPSQDSSWLQTIAQSARIG